MWTKVCSKRKGERVLPTDLLIRSEMWEYYDSSYNTPACKDRFPLQVRLSIRSGLGLSLQAGPSVTRSLGSDVTRNGDIQDEIQTKGTKFP